MANLPELNEFTAGVYQIETSDPVLGGVDGTTNVPLKALVNRSRWLKNQVDALNTAIASAIDAAYVQGELNKLQYKAPVLVATTTNITLSGLQTIDGVSLVANDRVLVKNQSTASQNGIYLAQDSAWIRAADMNADAEVLPGMMVVVSGGTNQAETIWLLTTDGTISLGSTSLNFQSITNSQVSLTGDQTIGGVKTFSSPPVVPVDSFSFAQLQNIAPATILGRVSAGTGDVEALTGAQATALLSAASETVSGRVELADAAEAAAGTNGTNALTPLRLRDALAATGSAPIFACRAWVNFNGTGTVAIRASGNVSSITDNGVGDYTVNFTTAMPDANYAVLGSGHINEAAVPQGLYNPLAIRRAGSGMVNTTSVRVATSAQNAGEPVLHDHLSVFVAIFR